jgi:hypothetical protein
MLAFVISCSSHHHDPAPGTPVKAFNPVAGDAYASFEEGYGKPNNCVDFSNHKYCEWKEKNYILFFKDGKYVSKLEAPAKPFNYEIDRECLSGDQKTEKKYQTVPGAKRLSVTSLEWKKHYPQIAKTLKATGLELGKANQQLKISYGLKELPGSSVKRYLKLSAVQKNEELWKINVSSKGTSRDLNQVMPALLLASFDLVADPTNETKSMIISDSSLHMIGFRHFLQSK